MSLFANLTSDGLEDTKDSLGGFSFRDSDIYKFIIKAAYVSQSKSGATAINFIFEDGAGEYRESFWITNKEGSNSFKDRSGKSVGLPGYTMVNDICLLVTGHPLASQTEVEEKVINLYDSEQKKELPTKVNMIMSLIGKKIDLAITKQEVNKQVKDSSGNYVNEFNEAGPVTREQNAAVKAFHDETQKTVNEFKEEAPEAVFASKWLEKNKGKVINRVKTDNAGGNSGKPPVAGGKPASSRPSLFGK